MITMRYGNATLRLNPNDYGYELKKYRRDKRGRFAPAERDIIVDRASIKNVQKAELMKQLRLI